MTSPSWRYVYHMKHNNHVNTHYASLSSPSSLLLPERQTNNSGPVVVHSRPVVRRPQMKLSFLKAPPPQQPPHPSSFQGQHLDSILILSFRHMRRYLLCAASLQTRVALINTITPHYRYGGALETGVALMNSSTPPPVLFLQIHVDFISCWIRK